MDELINIMSEILEEIRLLNSKLDDIRGTGLYGVSDVCDKMDDITSELESIKGDGLFNSVSDVCDKIDSLEATINAVGEIY